MDDFKFIFENFRVLGIYLLFLWAFSNFYGTELKKRNWIPLFTLFAIEIIFIYFFKNIDDKIFFWHRLGAWAVCFGISTNPCTPSKMRQNALLFFKKEYWKDKND